MNIQNIQMAQGLFRAVDGKSSSGKGNISAESNSSLPEINLPQAQEKTLPDQPNFSKEQVRGLMTYYPPFFPLGDTQLMNSVESVKIIKEEKGGASAVSVATQKEIKRQDNTHKMEAVPAQRQVARETDGPIKNKMPVAKHIDQPGVVLDIKI